MDMLSLMALSVALAMDAFAVALALGLLLKLWLASRQIRHVARHRGAVPVRAAPAPSPGWLWPQA